MESQKENLIGEALPKNRARDEQAPLEVRVHSERHE